MGWFIKFLLTWAALIAMGYYVGLPQLAKYFEKRTRAETMDQCQLQLQQRHFFNTPGAPLTLDQANSYCHCLADAVTFTANDIIAMAKEYAKTRQRSSPPRLADQIRAQVETCNPQLQHDISGQPVAPAPGRALPPEHEHAPTTYLIH